MATTDDETLATTPGGPAWLKPAKRYGPILVVALLIAGAIAAFGGGGGDDDDGGGDTEAASDIENEDLIRSGPMTPQKAELLDEADVDFGPNCDPETSQIRLPTVLAPPCVVPFEGDNGGATSPGVTGDEILVVRYDTDPALDPLAAAQVAATGADVDPASAVETIQGYLDTYNEVFETYGREVRVEQFIGAGASDDTDTARADAIEIAEMGAFAVIGGPARAGPAFATALAERGVMCLGTCGLATPESIVEANQPFQLPAAQTPNQAGRLAGEVIGNLAGPGPAALAGDEAMQSQDRVYALLHFDNADGDYEELTETFTEALGEHGIEITTPLRFELDLPRMQENARSMIARLEEDGVTTVILQSDPLTPAALTAEATAQDYFPEWVIGPNVLVGTAVFGRTFDQEQWVNAFGISLEPARGEEPTDDAYRLYEWANGTPPPNNTYDILHPDLYLLFIGIHLAGETLTPASLRDGLYRYPPTGGSPLSQLRSYGNHGVWPELDLGGIDDAAVIWWDPTAEGDDETGNAGTGLYRYANGGERYTLTNFPTTIEDAGLFEEDSSVTIYQELPSEDEPPDYPTPG